MSRFAARIHQVQLMFDAEFGSTFDLIPMFNVINAEPTVDNTRATGLVRAILEMPGGETGAGWALSSGVHLRSVNQPTIFFLMTGVLNDLRPKDRLKLRSSKNYPDKVGMLFEVRDPPVVYGMGRFFTALNEIPTTTAEKAAVVPIAEG